MNINAASIEVHYLLKPKISSGFEGGVSFDLSGNRILISYIEIANKTALGWVDLMCAGYLADCHQGTDRPGEDVFQPNRTSNRSGRYLKVTLP